jgi:molybdopterin synthase catalytic subunit
MTAVSAPDPTFVLVTDAPLSLDQAYAFVADPGAGGICVFVGTVRDRSDGGAEVTGLTYEAWDELAATRLSELAAELHATWPLRKVALLHRTGALAIGEASVIVAVSSAHRAEAFAACRHGIDQLKVDVPIWKKESFTSGDAEWVMGA